MSAADEAMWASGVPASPRSGRMLNGGNAATLTCTPAAGGSTSCSSSLSTAAASGAVSRPAAAKAAAKFAAVAAR
eukprot:CAMPEP_0174864120 /NCGR_PEP_ID=MMETSP1114-20130205/57742_1 /TAXON_ID=312471 /ORGANISM="Neobodo designis, Strain CCAP 1951/1" /LENGTH=74 /DNA_ID=CAMNT_0016099207 /DNA_START=17 /DNA_END=241 /DNA_ORIENTATION=-